jgi:phage shock protein A
MASVLKKFNTLISANVHAMIDRALRSNSLKVLDEYIRQAENNLDDLEDSAATIGGTVKTLKRKYEEFSAQVEKLDRDIDTLLVKNKNELALAAQTDINNKQNIADEYYEQWQAQELEYKRLMDARLKLEAKLVNIRQQREQMKALMELTAAKQLTTQTVRSLNDLAGVGDEDIRNLTEDILTQLDRAEAESEIASSRLQNQVDDVIGNSQIEMQLEERRKRLGISE